MKERGRRGGISKNIQKGKRLGEYHAKYKLNHQDMWYQDLGKFSKAENAYAAS
jgi:hypothetical protein